MTDNLGSFFCTECTGQSNYFELIPTVEMETRNPVESYFGNEFPAICNYCRVMAAWSCKTLKRLEKFCFFGKTTPYGKKKSKLRSESFYRDTDPHVVFKFGRREIGEIVRCLGLPDKQKFGLALQLSLLCGSRPKSARTSPRQCVQNAPDFIISVLFRRSYRGTREHRQDAP